MGTELKPVTISGCPREDHHLNHRWRWESLEVLGTRADSSTSGGIDYGKSRGAGKLNFIILERQKSRVGDRHGTPDRSPGIPIIRQWGIRSKGRKKVLFLSTRLTRSLLDAVD